LTVFGPPPRRWPTRVLVVQSRVQSPMSTAAAIDTILGVLAALLLTASAVVLWIARAPTASVRSR
jgi:hypothetical protein